MANIASHVLVLQLCWTAGETLPSTAVSIKGKDVAAIKGLQITTLFLLKLFETIYLLESCFYNISSVNAHDEQRRGCTGDSF
jgi:hypothetical protein